MATLELKAPTKLSEIPLKHYQDFKELCEKSNDEEFISHKTIEIFCGIRLKDAVRIKARDIMSMIQTLNQVFTENPSFIKTFKIRDIEFGFIPNLENMSWAEYIDLEKHLQEWSSYHRAMAVMYRPITTKIKDSYEIMEYKGTEEFAEIMRYAPLDAVLSSSLFFWNLENELYPVFLSYLETLMKTKKGLPMTLAKRLNLAKNGGGITQSIELLRETLESSMRQRPHLSFEF